MKSQMRKDVDDVSISISKEEATHSPLLHCEIMHDLPPILPSNPIDAIQIIHLNRDRRIDRRSGIRSDQTDLNRMISWRRQGRNPTMIHDHLHPGDTTVGFDGGIKITHSNEWHDTLSQHRYHSHQLVLVTDELQRSASRRTCFSPLQSRALLRSPTPESGRRWRTAEPQRCEPLLHRQRGTAPRPRPQHTAEQAPLPVQTERTRTHPFRTAELSHPLSQDNTPTGQFSGAMTAMTRGQPPSSRGPGRCGSRGVVRSRARTDPLEGS